MGHPERSEGPWSGARCAFSRARSFAALRMTILLVAIALIGSASIAHAQQTDVIRGRIIGPDSAPLRDVNVKATSYQGNVAKTAKTDKDGRFNIVFLNGEGDYWIDLQKVGYSAKRFEIR